MPASTSLRRACIRAHIGCPRYRVRECDPVWGANVQSANAGNQSCPVTSIAEREQRYSNAMAFATRQECDFFHSSTSGRRASMSCAESIPVERSAGRLRHLALRYSTSEGAAPPPSAASTAFWMAGVSIATPSPVVPCARASDTAPAQMCAEAKKTATAAMMPYGY